MDNPLAFASGTSVPAVVRTGAFTTSVSPLFVKRDREQACHEAAFGIVAKQRRSNEENYRDMASEVLRDHEEKWFRSRRRNPTSQSDFETAGKARRSDGFQDNVDLTAVAVPIVAISRVSASGDLMQFVVDVSGTGLGESHVAPGQFIQIGRADQKQRSLFGKKKRNEQSFVTLSSRPGAPNGMFEFLVSVKADPCNLASLKVGNNIRISPVIGRGLDYRPAASSPRLLLFVDAPQGLAAARSFVECEKFRAASGNGANRTTRITIYYSVPTHKSLGYVGRFSKWLAYGVNVVPILGLSLMEYLSTNSICGQSGHLRGHVAIACVASPETFEALRNHVVLYGLPTSSIQSFTQRTVAQDAAAFDNSGKEWSAPAASASAGDAFDPGFEDAKRRQFEEEIWNRWAEIRNSMRVEFERRWAAKSRTEREKKQSEAEKQQAWASWFGRNYEKWNQTAWDGEQWANYWSSWSTEQGAWTKDSSWKTNYAPGGSSSGGPSPGYAWNQQNSQEYWDWVGRGTGARRSSSSDSAYSSSWDYNAYAQSGGTWGNANNTSRGYQDRGYRYEYNDEDFSRWSRKKENKSSSHRSGSGWSGWNPGGDRAKSGRRSESRGQRDWTGSRVGQDFIDFYAVLGLESNASKSEIKRAYRKKAMEHHPDRNLENSELAHVKMKEIVVAYTVLKDDSKRKQYDAYGPSGL